MTRRPTPQQLYTRFCDSLINCNGLDTDPKTRAEAKAMYSFDEYMKGGAYDEDINYWEDQQFKQRNKTVKA